MKDYTVLIIEDDYYVRELYERVLSNAEFKVISAADGQEGFQLAIQNQPQLVLLDVMLPGKNGLAVLKDLKSDSQTQNIDVIMMTNLGQDSIIKDALDSGAAEYLLKPEVDPYELAERIEEFYQRSVSSSPSVT